MPKCVRHLSAFKIDRATMINKDVPLGKCAAHATAGSRRDGL